jgi:C4-dicarboxylate-specific signal transduction histidine kinase
LLERHRRLNAEAEARKRMSELAHLNRYSTAGEMSASFAHELNQPLGAILVNIEAARMLLSTASPDLKEIRDIIADVKRDDLRATEVIRRLRNFVTKTTFERRELDLNEVVREALNFISDQAAARNVTLNSILVPQTLLVSGDQIQLQQVILNLVLNAIEAVTCAGAGARRIKIRTTLLGPATAEVSVADSGPGISSDQLTKIFEPFFTTKKHGMGVGLSIACTIVQAHGGRMWAENRAEGECGAIFRINLPLSKVHRQVPSCEVLST